MITCIPLCLKFNQMIINSHCQDRKLGHKTTVLKPSCQLQTQFAERYLNFQYCIRIQAKYCEDAFDNSEMQFYSHDFIQISSKPFFKFASK